MSIFRLSKHSFKIDHFDVHDLSEDIETLLSVAPENAALQCVPVRYSSGDLKATMVVIRPAISEEKIPILR